MCATRGPSPPVHPRAGHRPPGPLHPETRGPNGHAPEWWDWGDNGWPVLQCTRCLRSLPTADGGGTVQSHLGTCRFWSKTEEVRRTPVALGPDALPAMPPRPTDPATTFTGQSPNAGRGSLATCGDVELNPGHVQTEVAGFPRQVVPLDIALTAPGIRGHFALQPDAPGQTLCWRVRCGMSWQAPQAAATCPDGCAPTAGPPRRGQQSCLRHRQLVISNRSP